MRQCQSFSKDFVIVYVIYIEFITVVFINIFEDEMYFISLLCIENLVSINLKLFKSRVPFPVFFERSFIV